MNLLELNDAILYGKKKDTVVPTITEEDLKLFKRTVATSRIINSMFTNTDSADSFFSLCPDVKQIVGGKKCIDCFYACKLGYYMPGISTKLVYIVNKMFKENDKRFVNKAMNTAVPLLRPYVNCAFKYNEDTYTVKDVIENICGHPVQLLNSSVRKISVGDTSEVYIPDVERVALVPEGIAGMFSQDDCEQLSFNIDKGIMLNEWPIRTLGNRLGITRDDFDLRECI
jgi:hypothetical protein